MNLRLTLHELSVRHGLTEPQRQRLQDLAGLAAQPAQVDTGLRRITACLAGGLLGLGLILWVAAQWDDLGRFGRLGLLQAVIAVLGLAAWQRPAWRLPLGVLVFLTMGGLFAAIGQTYQTGADPWQLFAVWALLGLPLAWAVRSDALWALWTLVVMVGLSLWLVAHDNNRWWHQEPSTRLHLITWALGLLITGALSAPLRGHTGAGPWSWRLALSLTASAITWAALQGLFEHHDSSAGLYGLGLLLLGAAAALLVQPRYFDVFGLSLVALGLNVLIVFGLGRLMLSGHSDTFFGALLLLGLVAAGLLAGSVSWILRLSRQEASA